MKQSLPTIVAAHFRLWVQFLGFSGSSGPSHVTRFGSLVLDRLEPPDFTCFKLPASRSFSEAGMPSTSSPASSPTLDPFSVLGSSVEVSFPDKYASSLAISASLSSSSATVSVYVSLPWYWSSRCWPDITRFRPRWGDEAFEELPLVDLGFSPSPDILQQYVEYAP